ncbi:MAG: methylamine utilization protein MauJ [Opitutaceae bacterium]
MNPTRWLTMAVERAMDWPSVETVVEYDGVHFYLLPETEHGTRAVAVELRPPLDMKRAGSAIRRFLSAWAWAEDQPLAATFGIGGGRRGGVGRQPGPPLPGNPRFHLDYLPTTTDPRARLALALYREALCLENRFYKFLGFFKIINVLHGDGVRQKRWINAAVPHITEHRALERLNGLRSQHADIGQYLFESGRCAVAHANSEPIADPDDPEDEERLSADLPLMQALAVRLIEYELQIKTGQTIRREHLYQLAGFRELFGTKLVRRFKAREQVPPEQLPTLPKLAIRVRDVATYPAYEALAAEVIAVEPGGMVIEARSPDGLVRARLGLDFAEERLRFEPHASFEVLDDGSPEAVSHQLDELRRGQRFCRIR